VESQKKISSILGKRKTSRKKKKYVGEKIDESSGLWGKKARGGGLTSHPGDSTSKLEIQGERGAFSIIKRGKCRAEKISKRKTPTRFQKKNKQFRGRGRK